jgi:curli biogenesis system outer membrane secretion channel CsgG
MKKIIKFCCLFLLALYFCGCATESHEAIKPLSVKVTRKSYNGVQASVSIGKFQNRSTYMRGLFSDNSDKMGAQAKTLLKTHMQQSGYFKVCDRANMEEMAREAKLQGVKQTVAGADYLITGQVTEFGRKQVGDRQLFGILGRGKKQVAYAKVTVNVVDIRTSRVVYSAQGGGEYALSNREIIGFGGTAGYDSTLNGKVLDLAIREAVDSLSRGIDSGAWSIK